MATPVSGAELIKAAFGALQALKDNLPENCSLSLEQEDAVVVNALARHGSHLATHAIDQHHLDPFKLICWVGWEIIMGLEDPEFHQHGIVIDALLDSLDEILVLETEWLVWMDQSDRELLKRFVMEEIKGNGDHGIGFNGLFIAFHCFRATYIQMNRRHAPGKN